MGVFIVDTERCLSTIWAVMWTQALNSSDSVIKALQQRKANIVRRCSVEIFFVIKFRKQLNSNFELSGISCKHGDAAFYLKVHSSIKFSNLLLNLC